ncbi:bifunctional phosphopantothenoylcysteine decarboxylase/phosphopantothenate--cysteine ligase CoaBC [Blastochloris sulfoviridis]|uniref:Coenzyme A biosynthesis bifunctional protein CoaBC n=1 Tax=Blastochloris sulfoviridis TaxID=50712 RepID=A0A5M6I117_9HYPH|nr:bifunctional phosphopantothenoylcysteine decarboxylase/phosphopantothenate--cysteine ligase CoaBC [Blastochloris sulfoviridis]KAA5601863.1 bifunctional phosphopantothenoylcysteine decarboxylase/phosphopantothenate--cysteine ligase CoaBC [Blastochloris sulfoviridis]
MSATSSAPAKRVLLVIAGGISAYKVLEAIRRLRERGVLVRCILTKAGAEFVTPLTVGTLSAERVFFELFDLTDEHDVGHIKLARDCDLVVVAPATADLIAKMALGLANDLASTALLATDRPILIVPAMNPSMWAHPATQANVATLQARGVAVLGPAMGAMAERGESGLGRMVEPPEIVDAVMARLAPQPGPLKGRHVLVTSGPTREPIDPVRYIANHSSGRQGHAIAAAAAAAGARVTLVSGPVRLADPQGVDVVHIETARDMLAACEAALPADAAVFAAAVADWRVARDAGQKIKKTGDGPPALALVENPDILATISRSPSRPPLVIGFAAETEHVLDHAKAKLARKGCDLIVANDVSPESGVMGGERNRVHLVSAAGVESWPDLSKDEVARRLVARIAVLLGEVAR